MTTKANNTKANNTKANNTKANNTKANNTKANNKETAKAKKVSAEVNAKSANDLLKKARGYSGTFKGAARILWDLAQEDATAKRVCDYLGINAETTTAKGISTILPQVRDKLALYETVQITDESGAIVKVFRSPAQLKRLPAEAGFGKNLYIAVPADWLTALINLAVTISQKLEYTQFELITTKSETKNKEVTVTSFALYRKSAKGDITAEQLEDCAIIKYQNYLQDKKDAAEIGRAATAAELAKRGR